MNRMLVHALRGDALRNLLRHRGIDLAQGRRSFAALQRLQQIVGEVAVVKLVAFERLLVDLAGGHDNAAGSLGHVRQHCVRGSGVGERLGRMAALPPGRAAAVAGVEKDGGAQGFHARGDGVGQLHHGICSGVERVLVEVAAGVDFGIVSDEVIGAAGRVHGARRAVRGHVNHHQIVGLRVARDPVELFLDVFGRGLLIGEDVHVVGGELADGRILEGGGKGVGVGGGVVELGNLAVSKVADADDERPLLLHGAGPHGRGSRCGRLGALCSEAARGRRGENQRIQSLIERLGAIEVRLAHGVVGERVVAEALLDQTAVVPRVAQLGTHGDGVLEQLQRIFKGVVAALRGDALQRLDDEILAGAAAHALRRCRGPAHGRAAAHDSSRMPHRMDDDSFWATASWLPSAFSRLEPSSRPERGR